METEEHDPSIQIVLQYNAATCNESGTDVWEKNEC